MTNHTLLRDQLNSYPHALSNITSDHVCDAQTKKPGFLRRVIGNCVRSKSSDDLSPQYESPDPQMAGSLWKSHGVIEPLADDRKSGLKVHELVEEIEFSRSEPQHAPRKLLFAHPAVSAVRPITPMSRPVSWESAIVNGGCNSVATSTRASGSTTSLLLTTNANTPGQKLRPRTIYGLSSKQHVEGEFVEFRARLDGHPVSRQPATLQVPALPSPKWTSEPLSYEPTPPIAAQPPTLQAIAPIGEFTIAHEPVFQTPDSPTLTPAQIRANRKAALETLLQNKPLPPTPQPGPPTLRPHPTVLRPGARPHSTLVTSSERSEYRPFQPAPGVPIADQYTRDNYPRIESATYDPETRWSAQTIPDHIPNIRPTIPLTLSPTNLNPTPNPPTYHLPITRKPVPRGPKPPKRQSSLGNGYARLDTAAAKRYSANPVYAGRVGDKPEPKAVEGGRYKKVDEGEVERWKKVKGWRKWKKWEVRDLGSTL